MSLAVLVPQQPRDMSRFIRQDDFVPQERLGDKGVTVIGVGAIGRQVAIQLASIGVRKIQLIDFDGVMASNITTQGFYQDDVGLEKVVATAELLKKIDSTVEVDPIVDCFREEMKVNPIVFLCVDKIETRKAIWGTIHEHCDLIIDGRMLGEAMQVITLDPRNILDIEYYSTTLFDPSEQAEERCTGHATIYCATIAAGLMVHQFTRKLRGFCTDRHLAMNLLSSEMLCLEKF